MKLWSRVCVLVLAVSPICLGLNTTSDAHQNNDTKASATTITSPHHSNTTYAESTTAVMTNVTSRGMVATTLTSTNVPMKETTTKISGDQTTRVSTTPSTSSGITAPPPAGSSAGYVVLALIIIVIIILCIILYLLRRASRTYSFDLQRPNPVGHLSQPTGTFEPVYLDDLERPVPKDIEATDDLSPPPVANGTSLQSEEKDSTGENAPEEQPEANGVETSPAENTTPSLSSDEADKISNPPSSTNLFFDAIGEQQNENNNNPTVCSSDPFVEINLDEPAWCDQLLNSSEGSSSVLPFSPFSLSSSSS
ncbi:uncharacterized protein LOC134624625 [Pelmatolapia mariae]|uniref:uncharacterized protein LOC134624625 n=1 Tax=Pelmatolapia mariae TaxID=158779 RepID=UPI002FE5ACF6